MLAGKFGHLIHVDEMGFRVHVIADDIEPAAGHIDRGSMGEMPAGPEIEPKDRVAGREKRKKHGLIGLAA